MRTGAQYITPPPRAEWALTPGPEPETNKLRELNVPVKGPAYPTEKKEMAATVGEGVEGSHHSYLSSNLTSISLRTRRTSADKIYSTAGGRSTQILAFPFHARWLTTVSGSALCQFFLKSIQKPLVCGFLLPLKTNAEVACVSCLLLMAASLSLFCCGWLNQVSISHFLTTFLPSQLLVSSSTAESRLWDTMRARITINYTA